MTTAGMSGPVGRLAAMLVESITTGIPIAEPPPAAGLPAIEAELDAYRVQALVAETLGPVVGWKVGRKSPQAEPICAPLFASRMNPSGQTLSRDAFRLWRIEAELAFRLARDLPPVGKPRSRDEVLAAVGEVHAVFEIVDSRYAAWPNIAPAMLLADLLSHGAMVIGSSVPMPAASAFETVSARLAIDGTCVVDGGGNPAGDILELLVWLANHPAPSGRSLRAGDLVTTGSFTGLETLPPGGHAEARFDGVGTVSIKRGR